MIELTRDNFTGPWAGLPVAWTDNDRIDEPRYRRDVARCCDAGLPGVYTGGTAGEFYAMEFDEFQVVARATVEECHARGKPAMVGVSAMSTTGATRRAEFAAEIDADAVQVALPCWLPVPDDRIVGFFRDVAEASGNLVLSVYDTTRTKKQPTIDQHKAIKDAVPSYTMVKSTASSIGIKPDACAALSQFVNVFVDEASWAKLGPHGAAGACSARAYYNPRVVLKLWEQLKRKDWDALAQGCAPIEAFYRFIAEEFDPRGFTDAAYDKLGAVATGFLECGLRIRGPYVSPTDEDAQKLRVWCRENWPEVLGL